MYFKIAITAFTRGHDRLRTQHSQLHTVFMTAKTTRQSAIKISGVYNY